MRRNEANERTPAMLVGVASAFFAIIVIAGCGDTGDDSKPPNGLQCGSAKLHENPHQVCTGMEATGDGACYCFLGFAWNGAACVGVNGCECKGADCDKLAQTLSDCETAHKTCGPTYKCGSDDLYAKKHDVCTTMQATGDGACYCFLGFAWNGAACVGVNGCECKGADCDKLAQTLSDCETAHKTCQP